MATYNTYADGKSTVSTATAAASAPAVTTLEQTFDAAKRNLAAEDVVELIRLPAGTAVHKVFVEVLSGESGQTLNVGDGDDPDGYVAAADVATTGTRAMGGGALADGKFYADSDTLDIEVPATKEYSGLKVRVVASVTMMG